ncbi:MAG TPA: hypothetical protein VGH86_11165 [Phenylobacterium sp.]|jgi:hypothetical protein
MAEKIELGSPEWLAALKAHIERFVATPAGQAATFSICEVFTDVPKHLDKNGDGVLAWYCRIADGKLVFAEGEVSDVDMKTLTDYDFIVPFARMKLGPENAAEFTEQMNAGVAAGKLKRAGQSDKAPPPEFHAMHNDLAEITA